MGSLSRLPTAFPLAFLACQRSDSNLPCHRPDSYFSVQPARGHAYVVVLACDRPDSDLRTQP
eukprot:2300670-Heterocapsa_arctica.AAC.1